MTRASHYERSQRSAPRQSFNGGYYGHGKIEPMRQDTAWSLLIGGNGPVAAGTIAIAALLLLFFIVGLGAWA